MMVNISAQPALKKGEGTLCLGGGGLHPKAEMLRFVVGPDGLIYPDATGKLPGEGGYVLLDHKALLQAVTSGALEEGIGGKLPAAPAVFMATITALLNQRLFAFLGLLRKGGQLTLGADKTLEAAKKNTLGAIFCAQDAGLNTLKKMAQDARAANIPLLRVGQKADYEKTFAKANCTLVGMQSQVFTKQWQRLVGAICHLQEGAKP